jgi:hypothetical protein
VGGSGGSRRPSRVVGKVPTYRVLCAEREVGDPVDVFEKPASGNRAGRGHCIGGLGRVREDHTMEPEAGDVWGGGRVLACEEVGVDHAGREVVGRPEVFS